MSAIFRPLDANLNRIVRGQLFIRQLGAATEQNCGSVVVEFTPKRESTEIKTNEDPSRPIVARPTVDLQGEFKVTFSQWTKALTALAFMAPSGEFFTQAAVVARTQSFASVENGDVLVLLDENGKRVKNVTSVSVTVDGGGGPLVALRSARPTWLLLTRGQATRPGKRPVFRSIGRLGAWAGSRSRLGRREMRSRGSLALPLGTSFGSQSRTRRRTSA